MTWTNKEEFEGSINLTKSGNNTMHTFFNNNISEFGGNLEGMLDEGNYRSTVQIFTNLVGGHNNSSLLMFQCWVMVVVFHNIPSFMMPIKKY